MNRRQRKVKLQRARAHQKTIRPTGDRAITMVVDELAARDRRMTFPPATPRSRPQPKKWVRAVGRKLRHPSNYV